MNVIIETPEILKASGREFMKLLWVFVIAIVGYDIFRAYKLYRRSEEDEKRKVLSRIIIRAAVIVVAILNLLFGKY